MSDQSSVSPKDTFLLPHPDDVPPTGLSSPDTQAVVSPAPAVPSHFRRWLVLAGIGAVVIATAGFVFFTDFRYKLPWFQKDESALVQLMYQRLSDLNGADLSLTATLGVGARDRDVTDTNAANTDLMNRTRSTAEEKAADAKTVADIRQYMLALEAYRDDHEGQTYPSCPDAKPACNPADISDVASFFGSTFPSVPAGRPAYAYARVDKDGVESGRWYELTFTLVEGTGGLAAGIQKATPTGLGTGTPTVKEEPTLGQQTDEALSFFGGDWFTDAFGSFEESIPDDLEASLTFRGGGLHFGKNQAAFDLPDVEASVTGSGKFNAVSAQLDLAGKVVDGALYYRVNAFPVIDITKGNQKKWIRVAADTEAVAEAMDNTIKQEKEVFEKLRSVILATEESGLLIFKPNGKTIVVDGIRAKEFSVTIDAQKVPDWFVKTGQIVQADSKRTKTAESIVLTDAQRQNIISRVERAAKNVTATIALHPGTGDFMNAKLTLRVVPPGQSKKFAKKQFNLGFDLQLWNHNAPGRIVPPSDSVDQDEIDRESLGLSKETYADFIQARQVVHLHERLQKYYAEHKSFPAKLSEISRSVTDVNTGKSYPYKASGNNFELTYVMNDVEATSFGDGFSLHDSSYRSYPTGLGYDALTNEKLTWKKGENVADRYSLIADQLKAAHAHTKKAGASDYDVQVAITQNRIAQDAGSILNQYFSEHQRYPETVDDLKNASYVTPWGFVCEDLKSGSACDYQTPDTGKTYTFSVTFGLASTDIDAKSFKSLYTVSSLQFTEGRNTYPRAVTPTPALTTPTTPATPSTAAIPPVTDADYIRGDASASLTLVEYCNFSSPYCHRHQTTLQNILAAYPGRVRWVLRQLPQIYPEAEQFSLTALCAGNVGGTKGFWDYADLLHERASLGNPATLDDRVMLAKGLGIDETKFQTCLDQRETADRLKRETDGAQGANIVGVPTTYLIRQPNELVQTISGAVSEATVRSIIDTALGKSATNANTSAAITLPAELDTDGDGLGDANELSISSDPKKSDTDGDGFSDFQEYYGGFNVNGAGASTIGSWSTCVDLSTLRTCAAYCQSIGKTCPSTGIPTTGQSGYSAETWGSADECSAKTGATKVNTCTFATLATDARWKCFCR